MDYLPLIMLFAVAGTGTTAGAATLVGYKRGSFSRRRPQKLPTKPTGPVTVCTNCGSTIPPGSGVCEKCSVATSLSSSKEDKVYDYIVNHQGIISLSTASADLGIPVEELKKITEHLKRQGRLS